MKLAIALILGTSTAPALADAMCVGAGFGVPVPGAVEVERRSVDVASARFAGLWQEGRINGLRYRVYSNRTGMVADNLISPTWRIDVLCDSPEGSCLFNEVGAPPPDALLVVNGLALCLTGAPLTASDFGPPVSVEPPSPDPSDAPQVPVDIAVASPPPEAEAEAVATQSIAECDTPFPSTENAQVRDVQSILSQTGYDPGPVDGLIGPMTNAALIASLGPDADDLPYAAALSALRANHCQT